MTAEETTSAPPAPSLRRRIWRIVKRGCLAVLVLLILFLIGGFIYEQAALSRIANELPPPGKLVDIGSRSLHLSVQGDGAPTVIFESGLGAFSVAWDLVAPKVAEMTRVVTYDRAGLGWSDPGPRSDADQVAADLNAALRATEIEGPYILVGHSIGGVYMRMFSYRYLSDVAGVVLVDSSHEDQFDEFPEAATRSIKRMQLLLNVAAQSARCGIPRMVGVFDQRIDASEYPEHSKTAMKKLAPSHAYLRAVQHEMEALPVNGRQLRAEEVAWNDLPLVVLTAGREMPAPSPEVSAQTMNRLWRAFQQELASRSTNATHRVVEDSGHGIPEERPDVVIKEILRMVETVRNTQ